VIELLALSALLGLATWRVASLLHTEDAFEWLRVRVGIGHDEAGFPIIYPDTFWARMFGCFWCMTLLVALPCTVLLGALAGAAPWYWPALWLAGSTVAIWTEKQIMRSQSR